MNLLGSHTMVFGLKKSGKSNFVQWLLSKDVYDGHLMYDVCKEHDALNRYLPTHRRGEEAFAELNGVVERTVVNNDRDRRPDVLGIEEVSRFCSPNSPPPEAVYELVDMNRHYGIGILGIARRPAQVHTDMVELADNLIVFRLRGKNDRRRLNAEVAGLGDAVVDLDEFEFIHVDAGRDFEVYSPVEEMDTTGNL